MAMSLGSSGRGLSAEMNVTPLIDVLLVLIIIFMIIRPLSKTAGLDAEIPQPPTDKHQPITPGRTVVIEVAKTAAGEESITINRQAVAPADLESAFATSTRSVPNAFSSSRERMIWTSRTSPRLSTPRTELFPTSRWD